MTKSWIAIAMLSLSLAGCATPSASSRENDNEQNEVKIAFDQLPPAVKATFAKEAPGVQLKDVDQEMQAGRTIYEADAVINGQNFQIKVAQDGQLISKAPDNEADEKGQKANHENREEKGEHNGQNKD